MKVEGSHRSSLMLLWNSFAADFAFHFFLGSIYQYREEKKTEELGKRSFVRAKKRAHNGRLQAALRARKLRAVLGLRHILLREYAAQNVL